MMENIILTVDVRKGKAVRVTLIVQNTVAQAIAHHSNLSSSLYLIIEVVKLKIDLGMSRLLQLGPD